jgi:VCBS repeat-containing protein
MASKVSFDKTPQAGDDFLRSASTGLTEDSAGVVRLDVLANDKGGNAKKLYSLDDGNSSGDLLTRDAPGASGDFSAHGAKIWITSEGTVAYDSSTWSEAFKAELQHLAPGQFLQDSFTYAIQLGNGALSWATVTLQIAGVNDAPTITSGAQTGSVQEDEDLSATGQVIATDPDHGDHRHYAVAGDATGSYGTLSIGANGIWTYTLNQGASVDVLAEGEEKHETFTVQVTDDYGAHADQDVTITVIGTNDAADISGADSGAVTVETNDDAGLPSASGDLFAADVDNADDLFQAVDPTASAGGYGTYQVSAAGFWTYTLDNSNAAVDALGDDEQLADSFTVHSADGTAHVVNVTISGASDASGTIGTDVNDVLVGGDGDDFIWGKDGTDLLTGGGGADRFYFASAAEGIDLITDFTSGPGGDILDLHDVLEGFTGYDGTNAFSDGYLFFIPDAGGTIVAVSPHDGVHPLLPLAVLQGTLLTMADSANYVL